MPFQRPTLTQLKAQAAADIATAVPGADALLRFSNFGILGKILAALVNGLYGYLDWIAQQAVPFTATDPTYVQGWAALKNIFIKPAVAAGVAAPLTVRFSGANGTPLPNLWPLVRSDGVAYTVTGAGVVAMDAVTVPAACNVAGSSGTVLVGQTISLATQIAGINSTGVVVTAGSAGADVETDAALRERMLQAYQNPPQGGDAADYVTWALDVPGVTRAWTVPLEGGPGTVTVYFMMDVAEAAFAGFPQGTSGVATNETRAAPATGDQLAVANAVYPRRPVTALVTAKAPGQNTIALTINGLAGAGAALQAAVAATITGVLMTLGAPGGAVDGQGAAIGPVDMSYIQAAIGAVAGTAGFVVTAVSCSHGSVSPTNGNITSNAGYLPVLGAITWS
jgi:uncharacterized phage protein gp47/JayE